MGRGPSPLTNRGEEAPSPVSRPSDATLLGMLAHCRRRLRLARFLESVGSLGPFALAGLVAAGALFVFAPDALWVPVAGAAAALLVASARAARAPNVGEEAVSRLERASGALGDPLRTWRWVRDEGREDDPFAVASLERLWKDPIVLDPVRAVPLPTRGVLLFGACALGSLGLTFLAPARGGSGALPAPVERPVVASPLAPALDAAVTRLRREIASEEGRAQVAALETLVERAERGELERTEALRAIAAEARRLAEGEAAERALSAELARRGESFSKHAPTRGLGTAFSERRLDEVAKALEDLAARLADRRAGLDDRELDELRRALDAERAERERRAEASRKEGERERATLAERLRQLDDREKKGALSGGEKAEQREARRKLEELDRRRAEPPPEPLDELDRQLAEAAKALAAKQGRKESARFLERAADSAKKLSSKRLTESEKRRLLEELRRLEEELRRGERNGEAEGGADDFERRARGQSGRDEGSAPGAGPPIEVEVPGVPDGGGRSPADKEGAGEGDSQGEGEGSGESRAAPRSGTEPGVDHDPEGLLGEASRRPGRAEDAVAVAPESGNGPTESETIRAAAQAGFTRSSYRNLYREYETAMEEVIVRDRVPAGRRAQVERYFDLIRPRTGRTDPSGREGR